VVIIDSTVWIDHFNGRRTPHTEWLYQEVSRQRFGLLDIILCEVLPGIRGEPRFREVGTALMRFEVFTTGGAELAVATARNFRTLRARGRVIRATIDTWIATFCPIHRHQPLHNDRDFDHFEDVLGLRVIRP
jgi:hypothetical protein